MYIQIVRGDAAHRLCAQPAFREAWMVLRRGCPWATTFQEPGFVCTWYNAYRGRVEPILVLAREGDALLGLLPLCFSKRDGLDIAGMVHAEYHAWICAPEHVAAFGAAALGAARRLIPGRSPLHFQYLPPKMPVDWLARGPDDWGILRPVPRPILRLGDGKDVHDSLRKSSNRSKIKRLEKLGKLVFRQITDPEEFDRLFDTLVAPYNLRHAAVHGVAPFLSDKLKMSFHRDMMRVPGLLHATILTAGDTFAAFHLGVPGNGELQLGITVHNPWLSKHSPAKLHMLLLSKMLLEQGFEKFDLTPGGDLYKQRFANDWDTVHTLSVYRDAHAQALGRLRYSAMDKARAMLEARNMTPGDARALADRIRGRLKPRALPAVFRGAAAWISGRTETRIYTLDVARLPPIEANPAVARDDQARLLACPPTPRWPTRRERASAAIARFEEGMHLYTLAHGDELLCMGWLAEQPGEAFLAAEVPGYPLPAGAAVICDLYTFPAHRRRGHARTVLRAILRDAAAAGSRSVVLPVPAASEAARRLVEELGGVYAGSIRSITRWGKTAQGSDFPASAAPATPLQSSSSTGAPAVPAVHVE